MKFKYVILAVAVSIFTSVTGQNNKANLNRLKSDIIFLASDSLKGRYPGTFEDSVTAAFISNNLIESGYFPLIGNSPLIPFEFTLYREVSDESKIESKQITFKKGADYRIHPLSSTGNVISKVVNVNKGFANQGKETFKGKIGIYECDTDSINFYITPLTESGLSAILFYNGDTINTPVTARGNPARIPVVHITRSIANSLSDKDENVLSISAEVIVVKGRTYNIAAVNKKSIEAPFAMVGAHYDHLGFGESGSMSQKKNEIHNGADDNASGVAAMLELARLLKNNDRAVIFAAFGAEERGLFGSRLLADTLSVLGKLPELMVNMDMIGRLKEDKLQVGGVGTFKEADSIVRELNRDFNFVLTTTSDGYGASDHASFYRKEVPVLYLTTGVHRQYHTPDDDVDLINFEGLSKVTEFVCSLILNMSDSGFTPSYIKTEAPVSPGRQSFKVTLGVIPDFTYEKGDGFRIGTVTEGRAASKAGLKEGDIITLMKGKKINNIYDYMSSLGELNAGERIDIEIIRDGQKISLTINL